MINIIVARVANCNYAPIIFWSLPVANNGQRPVCSKHEKIYETIVEWPRLSSVSTLCTPTEKRYVTQNAAQCAHFLKRPYQWDNTIVHLWKCDKCCNFTFRQQRHGNEKKNIVESNCAEWNWPKVFVNVAKSDLKKCDALFIDKKYLGQSHSRQFDFYECNCRENKWTCNIIMVFFSSSIYQILWSDSIVTLSLPFYKLQYKNLNLDHYSQTHISIWNIIAILFHFNFACNPCLNLS